MGRNTQEGFEPGREKKIQLQESEKKKERKHDHITKNEISGILPR